MMVHVSFSPLPCDVCVLSLPRWLQDKMGLLLRHRDAWESVLHHARCDAHQRNRTLERLELDLYACVPLFYMSGQIIATSHDLTPHGRVVGEPCLKWPYFMEIQVGEIL